MANDLPYLVEYSRSGRAKCQCCMKFIQKDILRIATIERSSFHDGMIEKWHHADCFFQLYRPKTTGDFDHFDNIRWEDQEYLRNNIEGGGVLKEANTDIASSSHRGYKRNKATATASANEDFKAEYAKSNDLECCSCNKMIVKDEVCLSKKDLGSEEECRDGGHCDHWHHLKCFTKRRFELQFYDEGTYIPGVSTFSKEDKNKIKKVLPKIEEENIPPKAKKIKLDPEDFKEEKDLKNQQEKFFDIRDELSKLRKKKLTNMLEANSQRVPVGESKILDALADAILFGALEACPNCGGQFEFKSGTGYKCTGFLSEWVLCDNITQDPKRREFLIPEHLKNEDYFGSFQPQVQRRLLKITAPTVSSAIKKPNCPFKNIKLDVTDGSNSQDQPQFIKDLNERLKSTKVKLRVKGGGTVDPESRLEDVAHVYQREHEKFTVTLGLTNIQTKKNSFYKLQILKHDKEEKYWLFRSWGRIGTDNGMSKCDNMPLNECIDKFQSLYKEKSGNQWSERDDFAKVPQKMYPIDIDHVDIGEFDLFSSSIESKLKKPVQDLIRLIYDVHLMKKAMLEYEIDMEYMPLGKISENQINEAYSVLSELMEMIECEVQDKKYFIEASNMFYTLIPHNFGDHEPDIIDTQEKIAEKSDMLECFSEMQIAYNLLLTKTDPSKNPLDARYEQLKTNIDVLDRESDEYKTIEKYVKNTHAVTHRFELEIEEIFVVKRDGEESRYKPFEELSNRRLLWHGSRLTNFVGILSQGLRIAPAEAPRTGYMFGKGIYFADMVSKSAKFACFGYKFQKRTELVLLCEVALGNMYERYRKQYIEKLPPGYHSTWARGTTQPDPEKSIKREGGIEVPCGCRIPVTLQRKSDLLYNEFIVYDEAQVKVKYLVKMNVKPEPENPVPDQSAKSIFGGVVGMQKSIFGGTQFAQSTPTVTTISGPPTVNIFGGGATSKATSDITK